MGKLPNSAVYLLLLATFFGILSTCIFHWLIEPHVAPTVEDEDWGINSEQSLSEDTLVHPFKINIEQNVINDLKARLEREVNSSKFRLPPPLEGIGFEYGFNSKYLQVIGKYWLDEYNWLERQKELNKYPHFKTKIGGLDIHFQHVKSEHRNKETRPILILHGWPGSFVEFQKLIPILTDSESSKYSYELVIPSLPGFGFSSAASRPGMSTTEMATIFKRLMARLGYDKFFATGGGWGSLIVTDLSTLYPQTVVAAHCNFCVSTTVISTIKYFLATTLPAIFRTKRDYGQTKMVPMCNAIQFAIKESGYFHIQATKPDTIGAGLTHSPLGLAAYILEKFSTLTNRTWTSREDGGLLEKFTIDELLDNIMVYWVTNSITTSMRLYKEQTNPTKKYKLDRVPTNVSFSVQYMPGDVFVLPEYALEDKYSNIQSYTVESRGGHFAALEEPELVAQNILAHFDKY